MRFVEFETQSDKSVRFILYRVVWQLLQAVGDEWQLSTLRNVTRTDSNLSNSQACQTHFGVITLTPEAIGGRADFHDFHCDRESERTNSEIRGSKQKRKHRAGFKNRVVLCVLI